MGVKRLTTSVVSNEGSFVSLLVNSTYVRTCVTYYSYTLASQLTMSIMITILHFDDLFTPLAPYLHQVNNKPHLQNMSYGDHISFVIDRNLSSEVYMKEIYLYEKQELT